MRKAVQSGNGGEGCRNLLVLLQIFHVYYVASIATRAANPATKDVSPVSLLISEYAPTNKDNTGTSFRGYFFSLTAAEVLVAQSLKQQFRFALVNTLTKHHIELSLNELFGRAKGIYPSWSILL
jgi:hypothetical protein